MIEPITNLHGQPARFVEGRATSQTFLDFGSAGSNGYLKVEVYVDPLHPDHLTIEVQDFTTGGIGDKLPRVRLLVEGRTEADTPVYPGNV